MSDPDLVEKYFYLNKFSPACRYLNAFFLSVKEPMETDSADSTRVYRLSLCPRELERRATQIQALLRPLGNLL
ncbi:MAG: hypothetical protein R3B93_00690 [Bacteroidia bacterium]